MMSLNFPNDIVGIIVYLIGLLILWAIISIPVYFAGKAITRGKSDFGDAMGATLGGAIIYFLAYFGISIFLGAVIGVAATAFALIVALLLWLAVYRAAFRTSWIKAIAIVLVAWVILLVLDFLTVHVLGVKFPDFFPF